MSWNPIVVGVDASSEAAEAARFAGRVAERAGTNCHLVHATRDALALPETPDADRYRQALLDQARVQIVASLRDVVRPEVLEGLSVRLGAPPLVLQRVASALRADLVVLGGKHHSTLSRWLGGSTSLDVVRTSAVPVLVVAGADAVRRVLVAVDLSAAARPTLAAAERYAALFGAELRALSVLEPLPVIPEVTPPYDTADYYTLSEECLATDVWPLIRTPGVEKLVRHGTAVDTILREVAEWGADLLVLGSHGKTWAERMFVGSVTERLLNHLPASLLVVPPPVATVLERDEAPEARRQPTLAIA